MYNPSEAGKKGTIFGLPYGLEESDIVCLPVHLDVTASYGDGTARAPDLILQESSQLDLSLVSVEKPWNLKMAMHPKVVKKSQNEIHRRRAINVIEAIEGGKDPEQDQIGFVNEFCEKVRQLIAATSNDLLDAGKLVGVVGGDHSSPLGLIQSLCSRNHQFGILQIDAHMDLRDAYEGFDYSHASIMFNALKNEQVDRLVQVGIRDYCEEEVEFVRHSEGRVKVFFDEKVYKAKQNGINWLVQCQNIIDCLPNTVYVSVDMDGLDPSLCPNTGTPVPGGLQFNEVVTLLELLVRSGRKIIGFDVCETGKSPWDANVAARILYRLATYAGLSNGLLEFTE